MGLLDATMNCPDCAKEISKKAAFCPHCGRVGLLALCLGWQVRF